MRAPGERHRGRIGGVEPLDNPVWHALCGPQATLAEGCDAARRYRPEFTVFAGLPDDPADDAWRAPTDVVGPDGTALLVPERAPRAGWQRVESFPALQMVLDREPEPPTRDDAPSAEL